MSEDRLAEPEFVAPKGRKKGVRPGGKPPKEINVGRGVWNIYTMDERRGNVAPKPCQICGNSYLPSQLKSHAMSCAQAEALRNEKRMEDTQDDDE